MEARASVMTVAMVDTFMPASVYAVMEDSSLRASFEQLKLLIYLNQILMSSCIFLDHLTICF